MVEFMVSIVVICIMVSVVLEVRDDKNRRKIEQELRKDSIKIGGILERLDSLDKSVNYYYTQPVKNSEEIKDIKKELDDLKMWSYSKMSKGGNNEE
jgi:peptidoglycan hydrolase CwlO-like protein